MTVTSILAPYSGHPHGGPIVTACFPITEVASGSWSVALGSSGESPAWESNSTGIGRARFALPRVFAQAGDPVTYQHRITRFRVHLRCNSAPATPAEVEFYNYAGILLASGVDAASDKTAIHTIDAVPGIEIEVGSSPFFSVKMLPKVSTVHRWFAVEVDLLLLATWTQEDLS